MKNFKGGGRREFILFFAIKNCVFTVYFIHQIFYWIGPIYSKNAHIKKVCNDYFAEHESEESEASTFDETEVSEEAKPKKAKKTQQQPKRKYNKSTNSQTKKVLKSKFKGRSES